VLKNLLSNALKFTESGSVQLSIAAAPGHMLFSAPTLNDADTVLAFSVTDTGIGVPAEKLKLIFEAFQQADGTTSRKYGGTGLGLSISREIARLLGGAIAVTSEAGAGSTFTLYVPAVYPFDDVETEPVPDVTPVLTRLQVPMLTDVASAQRDLGAADPLLGAQVLVVDDDVRNVFALTSALELHGMSVLYADNGRSGIELLHQHPEVDLVLMDVMMPDMDGNETTAEIRSTAGFADLPVLFLTAKAMPGDRDKSLLAGASDYITKPVDLDRLLTVMRSWLAGRRSTGEGA
jgi:CheY-like chemotaxis protein